MAFGGGFFPVAVTFTLAVKKSGARSIPAKSSLDPPFLLEIIRSFRLREPKIHPAARTTPISSAVDVRRIRDQATTPYSQPPSEGVCEKPPRSEKTGGGKIGSHHKRQPPIHSLGRVIKIQKNERFSKEKIVLTPSN